jgi:hypothetical protein
MKTEIGVLEDDLHDGAIRCGHHLTDLVFNPGKLCPIQQSRNTISDDVLAAGALPG